MDNSTSLLQIQNWLQDQLINDGNGKSHNEVENYIKPGDQLTPQQCLGIYQTSYERRLIECMRKKFTALFKTLGPELFDDFSRMYLRENPSHSPSLSELGNDFPLYLESNRPDKERTEVWVDFMIAMAQFEIDLYRIFDKDGSEDMVFADQDTPDDHLVLQKAFGLGKYPFDVHRYYKQISSDEEATLGDDDESFLAFVRRNYHVYVVSLDENQFYFLTKLLSLKSISGAIRTCSKDWNWDVQRVLKLWDSWKGHWIKEGFFIARN